MLLKVGTLRSGEIPRDDYFLASDGTTALMAPRFSMTSATVRDDRELAPGKHAIHALHANSINRPLNFPVFTSRLSFGAQPRRLTVRYGAIEIKRKHFLRLAACFHLKLAGDSLPALGTGDNQRHFGDPIGHTPRAILARAFILSICLASSREAIKARWNEIDLDAKICTVPAAHTRAGRTPRVPLSSAAMAVLEQLAETRAGSSSANDVLFPGRRPGTSLPEGAMAAVVGGYTVHGFRSSFRDWCGEETNFPREIAEACLAHAAGDATEQAYRRGDALELNVPIEGKSQNPLARTGRRDNQP